MQWGFRNLPCHHCKIELQQKIKLTWEGKALVDLPLDVPVTREPCRECDHVARLDSDLAVLGSVLQNTNTFTQLHYWVVRECPLQGYRISCAHEGVELASSH